jgi:hypothetical protein
VGLFDNLFKSKPTPGEEDVVEAARRITEAEKARLIEAEKAAKTPGERSPGSGNRNAHAPVARAYSPRSLGQAVPPARPLSPGKAPTKAVRFGAAAEGGRPQEIRLLLDDVLPRIPPDLLNDATRDGRKELRFRVEDVTADIARGRAAVALARIAEQAPEIFKEPVPSGDETLIRLPLQKLVEQIGFLPVKASLESKNARSISALPEAHGPEPALPPAMPPAIAPTLFKPIAPVVEAKEPPLVSAQPNSPPPAEVKPSMPDALAQASVSATKETIPGSPDAAPEFQAAGVPWDAKISLNLSTVLRNCPKELICSPLPPIAEGDRIELALTPIESKSRQAGWRSHRSGLSLHYPRTCSIASKLGKECAFRSHWMKCCGICRRSRLPLPSPSFPSLTWE